MEENNIKAEPSTCRETKKRTRVTKRKRGKSSNRGKQARPNGLGQSFVKRKLYEPDDRGRTEDNTKLSTLAPQQKKYMRQDKTLPLKLLCLWEDCGFTNDNYIEFTNHTMNHLSDTVSNQCKWGECGYSADGLESHLSHHVYLTHLKSLGSNYMETCNLPQCQMVEEGFVTHVKYECEWQNCSVEVRQMQAFFDHVNLHAMGVRPIRDLCDKTVLLCLWSCCTSKSSDKWSLQKHLRTHTGEKIIACPHCSRTFANITKFCDHCQRQSTPTEQFQCSQCFKYFASDRLLRQHECFPDIFVSATYLIDPSNVPYVISVALPNTTSAITCFHTTPRKYTSASIVVTSADLRAASRDITIEYIIIPHRKCICAIVVRTSFRGVLF